MFTPIKRVFAPFFRTLPRVFTSYSHNMVTTRLGLSVTCTCCSGAPHAPLPTLSFIPTAAMDAPSPTPASHLHSSRISVCVARRPSSALPCPLVLRRRPHQQQLLSPFLCVFLGLCSCPDCRAWRPSPRPRNVGLLRSRLRGGTQSQ